MNSNRDNLPNHISQQFHADLEDIRGQMLEMGGIVERQISNALDALVNADSGLGSRVIDEDDAVDALEVKIDEDCNLIIARRQPAASDLRLVLAIIKAIRDLERIGDESSKIARAAVKLSEKGELPQGMVEVKNLGERVKNMLRLSLDAFVRHDVEAALAVAQEDASVDNEYGLAMKSMISYMMEDPESIAKTLHLLWAIRAMERIGDHAKNICEHVVYLVEGMDIRHEDLDQVASRIAASE